MLFTLSATVAFGRTPSQQHSPDPNAIKIEIKRGEQGQAKEPEPFVVGDLFSFHLLLTNTSDQSFPLFTESQVLLAERPELRRSGKALAYREGVSARLQAGSDFAEQPRRPELFAHQSKVIYSFALADWFEPLPAGSYQLVVRHRFKPEQEWIESAMMFEVRPADPGLSKTPFTSDSLAAIVDQMVRAVLKELPGCRHERTTPLVGTENLVIDVWVCGRERVLSHTFETTSAAEATRSLQKRYPEANERIPGLGDEGLVVSGNIVVFSKGRLLIDVNSGGHSLQPQFGQQVKRNKEFARLLADALDSREIYQAKTLPQTPFATAAQLKIALVPADYRMNGDALPDLITFKASEPKIGFGLLMTNIAAGPVKVQIYFNREQNRPELFRDGQLVPYLSSVPQTVTWDKVSIDYRRLVFLPLRPNQPQLVETINLAEWYGPLPPGRYRLTNKHRLDLSHGELVECGSVTFEVTP